MSDNKPRPMSRRALVKTMLAAGAASAAGAAAAPNPPAADEAITPADLVAADKVAGRTFPYPDADRTLMLKTMTRTRQSLRALRAAEELQDGQAEPATHFDPRLTNTLIPTGKSSLTLSRGALPRFDAGDLESLAFASVADLSRLLKARKITARALTEMYLARLEKFGPRLLCVVNVTRERAREAADRADKEIASGKHRGPLHGVPYGLKDLFATRGYPTTWGAKPFANQQFDYDAAVVQRLDAAGAVLVAKLSMGELAMGDVWFGGTTRNPWDSARGSSGSSAGPGSAVAAGLVGFALGTETLGSIVSPCVANGVTGLRPTYGRVPRTGAMALSWTMDKIGPMCRGVEDCALVFAAINGADGVDASAPAGIPFRWSPASKLQDLRIGIDTNAFKPTNRNAPIYAAALETLKRLGIEGKPAQLPVATDALRALTGTIINVEGAASFATLRTSGGLAELAQQADWNWPNAFRVGATIPAADYLHALRLRKQLGRAVADALEGIDVLVTVPFAGFNLAATNLSGHPSLVTRCGKREDGLPVSLEFIGNLYREDAVLRVAHAFEQATRWHNEWPNTNKLPETPPLAAAT